MLYVGSNINNDIPLKISDNRNWNSIKKSLSGHLYISCYTCEGSGVYSNILIHDYFFKLSGPLSSVYFICVDLNNNIYFSCPSKIYKQLNESGELISQDVNESRYYTYIEKNISGSIYAIGYYDDVGNYSRIFKQTSGEGTFEVLSNELFLENTYADLSELSTFSFQSLSCDINNSIYVCCLQGGIYKQINSSGNFIPQEAPDIPYKKILCLSNGDVLAFGFPGTVYIQEGGIGPFIQHSSFVGISCYWTDAIEDINGDIYACNSGFFGFENSSTVILLSDGIITTINNIGTNLNNCLNIYLDQLLVGTKNSFAGTGGKIYTIDIG
jgi:hypothetical protein